MTRDGADCLPRFAGDGDVDGVFVLTYVVKSGCIRPMIDVNPCHKGIEIGFFR